MPRTRRRGTGGRFDKGGGRSDGRFSLHPENPKLESRMHATVPVRFGRGRLDSLGYKGLAAYLIGGEFGLRAQSIRPTRARSDPQVSGKQLWLPQEGGITSAQVPRRATHCTLEPITPSSNHQSC